jgi:hypothetical protein
MQDGMRIGPDTVHGEVQVKFLRRLTSVYDRAVDPHPHQVLGSHAAQCSARRGDVHLLAHAYARIAARGMR